MAGAAVLQAFPAAGDTERMADRFHRPREADDVTIGSAEVDRNSVKLDHMVGDLSDMRVAMTSLASDVKHLVERNSRHDGDHVQRDVERTTVMADIERRLRTLERRSYAIPGLGALLGLAGLGVAIYTAASH